MKKLVDSEIVKTCDKLVTCKEQGCRGTSKYPQSCWNDANLLYHSWCQTKKNAKKKIAKLNEPNQNCSDIHSVKV